MKTDKKTDKKTSPSVCILHPAILKTSLQAVVLGALMVAMQAPAATETWDGGGGDGMWNTGLNWADDSAPVSGDDIVIGSATTSVDSPVSINSLSSGGGTLNTLANLTLNGNVGYSANLALNGPIALTANSLFTRTAGTLTYGTGGYTAGLSGAYAVDFNINVTTAAAIMANPHSTYSGGSTIQVGHARYSVASSGTGGAPTAGPFGTGTITLGTTGVDTLAALSTATTGLTLHNNFLVTADSGVGTNTRQIGGNAALVTYAGDLTLNDDVYVSMNAGQTLRFDGTISGTGGLKRPNANAAYTVITGNNSYSGGTVIPTTGVVVWSGNNSLGTGPLQVGLTPSSGQTFIAVGTSSAVTIPNDVVFYADQPVLSAGSLEGVGGYDLTVNGNVSLADGGAWVTLIANKNFTANGTVSSTVGEGFDLSSAMGTTVTLAGVNTHGNGSTTGTTISGGGLTVKINDDSGLGAAGSPLIFYNFGGTLEAGDDSVVLSASRPVNLWSGAGTANFKSTPAGEMYINGLISGDAAVAITGGTVGFGNANTYAGITTVYGNTAPRIGTDTSFSTNSVILGETPNSAPVYFVADNGARAIANAVTLNTYQFVVSGAGNDLTLNGNVALAKGGAWNTITANKNLTINGVVSSTTAEGMDITSAVGTTVTLANANTHTGGTTIGGGGLTLNINSDAALGAVPGAPADSLIFYAGGGTLEAGVNVTLAANRQINLWSGAGTANFKAAPGTTMLINGPIYGTGNAVFTGGGTIGLYGYNLYAGTTTVTNNTTLGVLAPGILPFDQAVTVTSGATFGGDGTIPASVTVQAGAYLTPGVYSHGTLWVTRDMTLAGTAVMEIQKTGATFAKDAVDGLTNVTYGGTLQVVATGDALAAGDSIPLFLSTAHNGSFASITPATPGAGLAWSFTNGVLSVVATVNTTPTNLVSTLVGGTNLNLSWPGDHTGWKLEAQTNNLNVGLSTNWVVVPGSELTNQMSFPVLPANPAVFYRMVYP